MGCCCAKAVPVPPGKEQIVGTWISSPAAEGLKTGYAVCRYKRGLFGGLKCPPGEAVGVRLIIQENGTIHYVHVQAEGGGFGVSNFATLIDLPATRWTDSEIHLTCGAAPLQYSFSDNDVLTVNGIELKRAGAKV